jgi:hypothetical protein
MASLEEKAHSKISAAFADQRVSPAILAYKLAKESRAVNEAALAYMINYVIIMADSKLVPFHLLEMQQICRALKISLEELGLTGMIQQQPLDTNEYVAV